MKDTSLSRRMSLILRHDPGSVGIELDPQGWVDVDELVSALRAAGNDVSEAEIVRVVETSDKKRFELSDGRVRAAQGHSIPVDLELVPFEPPPVLWHGTVERFLESIMEKGLVPSGRQHVHLSDLVDTARQAGSRRGEPVLLKVDAERMAESQMPFYRSSNGVWLVDAVPPQFLTIVESPSDV